MIPKLALMLSVVFWCLIPAVVCLLRNCVTYEEWRKDNTTPKCEVDTIYDFTCLAKNQISVQRPQPGSGVKPEQTQIVCRAPYPIDVDVDGSKVRTTILSIFLFILF